MTDSDIVTTIKITALDQQRGYSPGIDGEPIFSDWSYSATVEVEIVAAGISIIAQTDLPLEKWQWDAIWQAKLEAHQSLKARVKKEMAMWNRVKSLLTPTEASESGAVESEYLFDVKEEEAGQ